MTRRTKLGNPARVSVPAARCIVKGCTTEPQPGALICFYCARALSARLDQAQRAESHAGGPADPTPTHGNRPSTSDGPQQAHSGAEADR